MTAALLIALLAALAPVAARGDASHIGTLRAEQRQVQARRDALEGKRRRIVAEAESLSSYIDSLKAAAGEVEELHEALRASMVLVQRLVALDRALEANRARQDSLLEELRLSYDWEIGTLIQQLQRQPDEGLLTQLMLYQEAREALGSRPSSTFLRYDEGMTIAPDDGPEEIRQKLALMEDLGERLQRDARRVAERLRKLEEEYRLRARLRRFAGEIYLFDGDVSEGRTLAAAPRLAPEGEGPAPLPAAVLRARQVQRQERGVLLEGVSSDEVLLEIHKLKARQQEIEQLREVVRERRAAFGHYLQKMLEGAE